MRERSQKNPAAVALGRLGGLKGGPARAKKLTLAQRVASARKAAKARWAKARRLVHRLPAVVLVLLAACGDGLGPGVAPYGLNVEIRSYFVPTGCINDWSIWTREPADTSLRLDWQVWFGEEEHDYAGHVRLGDTSSASWHGTPREIYRAHWQLGIGRPRPGYSDPASPDFSIMDYEWHSSDRSAEYRCGSTWRGF